MLLLVVFGWTVAVIGLIAWGMIKTMRSVASCRYDRKCERLQSQLNWANNYIRQMENHIHMLEQYQQEWKVNVDELLRSKDRLILEKNSPPPTQSMDLIEDLSNEGYKEAMEGNSSPNRLKSMNKTAEVYAAFAKNGIDIYGWGRECWKCHEGTRVFSYYLYYSAGRLLGESFDVRSVLFEVGVGYIKKLDRVLSDKFPTVREVYSKTADEIYYANICENCGATQGRNYVVNDPHEVLYKLLTHNGMDDFYVESIPLDDTGLQENDLKPYFGFGTGD